MSKNLWGYRSEICDDECIENCYECRKGKELVAVKMAMQGYVKKSDVIKLSKCTWRKGCTCCDFATDGDSWCEGQLYVVDVLNLPAEDVAPVRHGEWVYTGKFCELNKHECSQCGAVTFTMYNYCPNCGADMRPTRMSDTKEVD